MIVRHFNYGERDFGIWPDIPCRRNNWEFYVTLSGECGPQFADHDSPTPNGPGIWLMRPNTIYHWSPPKPRVDRVCVQTTDIPSLVSKTIGEQTFLYEPIDKQKIKKVKQWVEDFAPYYADQSETLNLASAQMINALSLMLLASHTPPKIVTVDSIIQKRVTQAEQYYHNNLTSNPTIAAIADHVNISPSQLRRDFRKIHQCSPQALFLHMRLIEAKRLLITTDMTIDNAALQSGFSNRIDFHRSFKKDTGITPDEWRREKWKYVTEQP